MLMLKLRMTNASMDMEVGESLIAGCRNGTGKITMGISIEIFQKAKTRFTYDLFMDTSKTLNITIETLAYPYSLLFCPQ